MGSYLSAYYGEAPLTDEVEDEREDSPYKISFDYCLENDLNKDNEIIFSYATTDNLREQLHNYQYKYAPSMENLQEEVENLYLLRQEAVTYILEKLGQLYYLPKVYFVYDDGEEKKTILQMDYITCPIKSGNHAFTVIFSDPPVTNSNNGEG